MAKLFRYDTQKNPLFTYHCEFNNDTFKLSASKLGFEEFSVILDANPHEFTKRNTGDVFARSKVLVGTKNEPGVLISHPAFSQQSYSSDPPTSDYISPFWDNKNSLPVIGWPSMRPGGGTDEDCIGWEIIRFNPADAHFNCDSFPKVRGGLVEMRVPVYLKPDGSVHRTGVYGRGVLGRWGPNGAVDPVVTCWEIKTSDDGQPIMRNGHYVIVCDDSGFPKLKYVGIVRKDTGELAHPGGMNIMQISNTYGENIMVEAPVSMTLASEYLEEACGHADEHEVSNRTVEKLAQEHQIRDEFMKIVDKTRIVIKRGRNADPRNTDHAWMCVEVSSIHCDNPVNGFFHKFELRAGSDAAKVSVISVTPNTMPKMYASHADDLKTAYDLQYYRLTGQLPGNLPNKGEVFFIDGFEYEFD